MFAATRHEDRFLSLSALLVPLTWFFGITAVTISLSPLLPELLQFDAVAIVSGEYWRFLTGHFVHWNFDHLLWDLGVFVVLGAMCERRNRAAFLGCVLGSATLISIVTLVGLPEMQIYRGLSGVDTALFALLCVGLITDARATGNHALQLVVLVAALCLITKTAYEFFSDATIFVDHTTAAFVPVPIAHVIGTVVGFAVGVWAMRREESSFHRWLTE